MRAHKVFSYSMSKNYFIIMACTIPFKVAMYLHRPIRCHPLQINYVLFNSSPTNLTSFDLNLLYSLTFLVDHNTLNQQHHGFVDRKSCLTN